MNDRTPYGTVCSSNRSRKIAFSLGFTRKRIMIEVFRFIIIIICTTLQYNITYRSRKWFLTNPDFIQIEPSNHLYDCIERIGDLLAGSKTLFLIDGITANETLDKRRNPLLKLAISGRHKGHLLWLLMQSYTAIPLKIRKQAKISEENGILFTKKMTSCKHKRK